MLLVLRVDNIKLSCYLILRLPDSEYSVHVQLLGPTVGIRQLEEGRGGFRNKYTDIWILDIIIT